MQVACDTKLCCRVQLFDYHSTYNNIFSYNIVYESSLIHKNDLMLCIHVDLFNDERSGGFEEVDYFIGTWQVDKSCRSEAFSVISQYFNDALKI